MGCPGSRESARVRCWRVNEKLIEQERDESEMERAGDVQVEGIRLRVLGLQDVVQSGDEDGRAVTDG